MTSYQRFLIIGYSVSLILNVIVWYGIIAFVPHNLPTTILHYNIYFGPDSFGQWSDLLWLPTVPTIIILLNGALSWWWQRRERLLATLAMYAAGVSQVIALIAMWSVIHINKI